MSAANVKAGRTRLEQETIVCFNEEELDAVVFTASPRVLRELEKRGYVAEPAEDYSGPGIRMVVPKRDIQLPRPRPVPQEQKAGEGGLQ